MDYLNPHLDVQPNPQAKVYASHNKTTPDVWTLPKLWVGSHQINETAGAEDVQQQVHANETHTGTYVWKTEQHAQRHYEVQSVLEVGPLLSVIQGLAVAHPKHAIVGKVSDVPKQQQRAIVMVDQDVSIRLKKAPHLTNPYRRIL